MGMLDHPARVKGIYDIEPLNIPAGRCRGSFHGPRPADSAFVMDVSIGSGIDELRMQIHLCQRCRERLICGARLLNDPERPACLKMLGHEGVCEWIVSIGTKKTGKRKGKRV